MLYEEFTLTEKYSAPLLQCFSVDQFRDEKFAASVRPAVLVLPGGGYSRLSDRESELIALSYLSEGFNAFVLRYGVQEHARFPDPLIEVSLAIKYSKDHASRYMVDPEHIFVIGFSAGGHLAASIGTIWNEPVIYEETGMQYGENRPFGTILSYPVISGDPSIWHKNSFKKLAGVDADGEPIRSECEKYSMEKRVTEHTRPAFLWSTVTDQIVPVENTLVYASALQAHKIPYELHIFPEGRHGLSLANELTSGGIESRINPVAAQWLSLSVRWMKDLVAAN